MPAPLLAVDAPSMLYRAFFALPRSIRGAGERPVNALLGSTNLIMREVEEHSPRAVVLCFGPDAAAYRVELYPGYHADRDPVPDELGPQFADAGAFFSAFGWAVAEHDSLEAVLEAAPGETRQRLRTSLLGSRADLLAFKQMATLQDAGVERPEDRATDLEGAASAARERGMNRLAERLQKAAGGG